MDRRGHATSPQAAGPARADTTRPAARPAVVVRRKPPVPKRPRPAPRPVRAAVDEVPVPKTPPLDERALKRQFDGIFSGEPAPPAPQPVAPARRARRTACTATPRRGEPLSTRGASAAATHDEAGTPLHAAPHGALATDHAQAG